jgi:hypothetical protein
MPEQLVLERPVCRSRHRIEHRRRGRDRTIRTFWEGWHYSPRRIESPRGCHDHSYRSSSRVPRPTSSIVADNDTRHQCQATRGHATRKA